LCLKEQRHESLELGRQKFGSKCNVFILFYSGYVFPKSAKHLSIIPHNNKKHNSPKRKIETAKKIGQNPKKGIAKLTLEQTDYIQASDSALKILMNVIAYGLFRLGYNSTRLA